MVGQRGKGTTPHLKKLGRGGGWDPLFKKRVGTPTMRLMVGILF
jgi:hypothetical protein